MSDAVLEAFLAHCESLGLQLYPEQEEAVLELYAGRSVILNTPTGSGKSLVAAAFHRLALARGELSVYTCPIKALVNEKFLALCREFGPDNVGMMTGDATVNSRAPILCCTAEILSNQSLARGPDHPVRAVIMDEFHYYGDEERGVSWQVPLLTLPQARFLLMSATLGPTDWIEREVAKRTGAPCVTVRGDNRPVPLAYEWSETPLAERVAGLLQENKAPVYLVHFTQRETSESAQALMSQTLCTREEKEALAEALVGELFASPYGKDLKRWMRHGIGVHHAGLLPRYRILVEKLAQRGLLKVICGTDTLGVGINVPIRTVLFTQLWKFDGKRAAVLSVRDFRQIAGRAGRRGYDTVGHVVAQAPEHVIENRRAAEKAASDPKKLKKLVKARPQDGAITWDENTFVRLRTAPSEGLVSRFRLTAGMLLLALSRKGDGCRAVKELIADCHEGPTAKTALKARAWQLFRALVEREIVTLRKRGEHGPKIRVNVELQDDFSLHQGLSLFLIDALPALDANQEDHALDVLTLCEAIVEDPEAILRAQTARERGRKIEELKAQGVPYEERLAKLEEIEHPKPKPEFFYSLFNTWAAAHPWIDGENLHLKTIAREMYEGFRSFPDYIREHGLERVEGLLLRHLSQVWKVLAQTVPDAHKTDAVLEIEHYLRELVTGVDASLLEEWEKLRDPDRVASPDKPEAPPPPRDITRDKNAFLRSVRHEVHSLLADAARRDWRALAARLGDSGPAPEEGMPWAAARSVEAMFLPYFEAHGRLRLDPAGRSAENTLVEEQPGEWSIRQVIVDPEDEHDWHASLSVDLNASREAGRPVLMRLTVHGPGAT